MPDLLEMIAAQPKCRRATMCAAMVAWLDREIPRVRSGEALLSWRLKG